MLTTKFTLRFPAGFHPATKQSPGGPREEGKQGSLSQVPLCVISFRGLGTSFQEDAWRVTLMAARGQSPLDDFQLVRRKISGAATSRPEGAQMEKGRHTGS